MRYLIAAIAAILAVLGFAGRASAQATSLSWYGYVVTGSTYTSTTADWTMPSLTCNSEDNDEYVAIWTGLDGYSSPTTEQIGALAECSDGTAEYFGWYEIYPGPVEDFDNTLKPGDDLDASVTYDGSSKFTLTLRDTTQGWDASTTQTESAADRSSAETVVEAPSTLSCVPAETLADFTDDTVDGTALGDLNPVEVTGSDPDITVSPVSGKSFSVTCKGSV
jgi:hypothetical protein